MQDKTASKNLGINSKNDDPGRSAMNPTDYMRCVLRTLYPDLTVNKRLGLCGLGLSGEIGEVTDLLKKFLYHRSGLPLDTAKLKDELGDVMWYFFVLLDTVELTFEQMMMIPAPKYKQKRAILSGLDSRDQLEFCALELASSLGKVVDLLNRILYWTEFHVNDLKDQLSDALWSMLILLDTLGLTFEEVMLTNAIKCDLRHPNGFNPYYSSDSHASEVQP